MEVTGKLIDWVTVSMDVTGTVMLTLMLMLFVNVSGGLVMTRVLYTVGL